MKAYVSTSTEGSTLTQTTKATELELEAPLTWRFDTTRLIDGDAAL